MQTLNSKIVKWGNYAFYLLFAIPLLAQFAVCDDIKDGLRIGKHIFIVLSILPLFFYFVFASFKNKFKLSFNLADVLFLAYIIYILLRGDGNGNLFDNEKFYWYIIVCFSYFPLKILFADIKFQRVIFFIFTITIAIQSILAILQLYGFTHSNYAGYITGSFFNPSLLGGMLASAFPLIFSIYKANTCQNTLISHSKSVEKYLSGATIFLILIVIPVTLSRAAWIGLLAGIGVLFIIEGFYKKAILWIKSQKSHLRVSILIAVPVLIIVLLFLAYFFKRDSADGRVLIWKVTTQMWFQKPLFGHGFDAVNSSYQAFQTDYFQKNTFSENEAMVAGNVNWSFNEFLQSGAELGIIGIFLFWGWILLSLLMPAGIKDANSLILMGCKSAIVGLLFFGMFSYPFYSPPLFFNLIMFAAFVSASNQSLPTLSILNKVIPLVVILGFGYFMFKHSLMTAKKYEAYWLWDEAEILYKQNEYEIANKSYTEAFESLKTNGKFLLNYGKSLEMEKNYTKADSILTLAGNYYADDVLYTTHGNVKKAMGNLILAEELYHKASYVIPHKFYPHFLLFRLYSENGEINKAIDKAEYLRTKKVKIPSKAIDEMLDEIDATISKHDTIAK